MADDSLQEWVLLPPSEGKRFGGGAGERDSFVEELGARRCELWEKMCKEVTGGQGLEKLLGVRGSNLDRAKAAWEELSSGSAGLMPAWERYSGVVWEHVGCEALSEDELSRMLVLSGAYGVTDALDFVADYRLKMSVSLSGIGKLSSWWREDVTRAVVGRVGAGVIIDLLPKEHSVALALSENERVIRVEFIDGARAGGHAAKAVKGKVAREILSFGLGSLSEFSWRGWRGRVEEGTDPRAAGNRYIVERPA